MSQREEEEEEEEQQQQQPRVVVSKTYTTNVEPENPLPLDWTKLGVGGGGGGEDGSFPVRYPNDVTEWSPDDTEVCIVGTAGQKITVLGTVFSDPEKTNISELTSLVLRSHLIKDMAGLGSLPKLDTLELYDNMVQSLDEISLKGCGQMTLRVLDMSYNAIRDMSPVQYCNGETLTELYLANNKLKSISGLSHLTNLRKLDLGANKIRVLDKTELSGLKNLEELWIGKNKIESLEGIESLTNLKRLDVQSNRLTTISNDEDGECYLNAQRNTLEELYLAHNGLDDDGISGLLSSSSSTSGSTFPQLTTLDLSNNRLTTTAPLVFDSKKNNNNSSTAVGLHWPMLEELWLSANLITDFEAIYSLKEASDNNQLPKLETVYLEYNPVSKDFEYRKKLAEFIPTLQQIDATMIRGYGSVPKPSGDGAGGGTTEDRLRVLQAAAIQRAKQQQ
jgi:protein phosphatase 1 regulatory subunit 7